MERYGNPFVSQSTAEEVPVSPDDEKIISAVLKKGGYLTQQELIDQQIKTHESAVIGDIQKDYGDDGLQQITDYWVSIGKPRPTTKEGWENLKKGMVSAVFGDKSLEEAREQARKEGENRARAAMKNNSRLTVGSGGGSGSLSDESEVVKLRKQFPSLTEAQIRLQLQELQETGY